MRRALLGLLGVVSVGLSLGACDDHINIIGTPVGSSDPDTCPDGTVSIGADCVPPDTTSSSGSSNGNPDGPRFSLTVRLEGLAGDGLIVSGNGRQVTVPATAPEQQVVDGLPNGTAYDIRIAQQPSSPTQECVVIDGAGTISGGNAFVTISCQSTPFSIGGTLTGLTHGTVTLTDRNTDPLLLDSTQNGVFTFASRVPSGSPYSVAVSETTGGANCTVESGSGTVGNGKVTGVVVNCSVDKHTVGGTVTGLVDRLTLRNGGQTVTVTQDGSFTFPTPLEVGTPFNVGIASQAQGQLCTVAAGQGTVGLQSVTSVRVTCTPLQRPRLHVAVTGLEAGTNGLRVVEGLSGESQLAQTSTTLDFAQQINGTHYRVDLTNPTAPAQACAVVSNNGEGDLVGGADVTVSVLCQPSQPQQTQQHRVIVQVSGLDANQTDFIEITNTTAAGTVARTRTMNGEEQFPARDDGTAFAISITHQPTAPAQVCTITPPGAGQVAAGVTVVVTCAAPVVQQQSFKLGVQVNGHNPLKQSFVVQNTVNGDQLSFDTNGGNVFPTLVAGGAQYNLVIPTQPQGEQCNFVGAASGPMPNASTTVVINCQNTVQ